mgnify:FL=1
MNARDGGAGAPLVPQGVMHLVAMVAIAALALALLVFPSVGARALPHDALEAAHEIEELPFRHDEVRLSEATVGPDEAAPSCYVPRHTAWYVLRPETDVPLSTWVVPDASGDTAVDVALSAWGSIGDGPPVEVGCVDERGAGAPEQLVFPALAGLTYYFAVSSSQLLGEDAGTLTFLVDEQTPAHDLFAFARWVDETPYEDAGVDASGARREPGESAPSCAALEATTWYGISSPQDAILSARVEPSSASGDPSDIAMALHTGGSVGSLLERACVDAAGPGEPEQLEFPVGAGEVYWMQVGAVLGETGPGEYTLSIAGMQTIELAPTPDTRFGAGPQACLLYTSPSPRDL